MSNRRDNLQTVIDVAPEEEQTQSEEDRKEQDTGKENPSMSEALQTLDQMEPVVNRILSGSDDLNHEDLLKPILLFEQLRPLVIDLIEMNQKLEREVRQKNRLKVLGEMASCLAHEIRTPLASVHLNLDRLEEFTKEDSEQRKLVSKISTGLDRVQTLVDDILTYSREVNLIPTAFSWHNMIEEVLEELEAEIENRDTEIICSLAEDLPGVEGDSGKISRAHKNVIQNAIQAAGSEGTVHIQTGMDSLESENDSIEAVQTTVEDNGPGIPGDVKDHLFTPFYSQKTKGTGLGLAISSRILKAHGGHISGQNREEQDGARFSLVLPVSFQGDRSMNVYGEEE